MSKAAAWDDQLGGPCPLTQAPPHFINGTRLTSSQCLVTVIIISHSDQAKYMPLFADVQRYYIPPRFTAEAPMLAGTTQTSRRHQPPFPSS